MRGLPHGVEQRPLEGAEDETVRCWTAAASTFAPAQWNVVSSNAGVLRGVHVHHRHDDYLCVVRGRAVVGLHDLRPDSPTRGRAAAVTLRAERPGAIVIPHGVAHGFWFPEPSVHLYAVSHAWDPDDELGCRWDDPELEIPWTPEAPLLSARDAAAGSVAELRAVLGRAAPEPLIEAR